MTSAQLEVLNRRNRILARLQAGETQRTIAEGEGVAREYVSRISVSAGFEVSREERIRRMQATLAIRKAAQAPWDEISRNLDRWNAEHGRTRKVEAA